jgi:hypothetical protein
MARNDGFKKKILLERGQGTMGFQIRPSLRDEKERWVPEKDTP